MSIIKDIFTEKDGVSFCPVRAAFVIGCLAYMFYTLHDLIAVPDFKFMDHAKDWASGLANLLGLGGGAVAGKSFTEPNT